MADNTQACSAFRQTLAQIDAQTFAIEQAIASQDAAFDAQQADTDAVQVAARAQFDAQMAAIDAQQAAARHNLETAQATYQSYLAILAGQRAMVAAQIALFGC